MSRAPVVGIIHPLILKDGELFFLCDHGGRIEPESALGLGFYCRDCRFLCRYELRLGSEAPVVLMNSAAEGFLARFEMTNPSIETETTKLSEHALAMARKQTLHADWSMLYDQLSIRNCTVEPVSFELRLILETRFEDIFTVRGAPPKARGEQQPPRYQDGVLRFRYEGADKLTRGLDVAPDPAPAESRIDGHRVELIFPLHIDPQRTAELDIAFKIMERTETKSAQKEMPARHESAAKEPEISRRWLEGYATVKSDDARLDAALHRSLTDIQLLTIERQKGRFIAAGVPWFVALFGRDSLVPSLQCLAYRPELAAHTLRLLAKWQGTRHAEEQKEEPGKILHELRVGELARLGLVAQRPGYGSIDSTILFLITLAHHAQWTGNTGLFEELETAVEGALGWMSRDGDRNGDGYIDYDNGTEGQAANQGWKDSADAISYPDGSLVRGRVSLVEVQAYAYLARTLIADLYRRIGQGVKADRLAKQADTLRRHFNRDFWMEEARCYCLALDQDGKQVGVISSNPGHALWAGIADPDKAHLTAERLMEPDMFAGWGVRTLSEHAGRFNPIGYHTGSVWPFDNSIILAGFRRYGRDDLAERIFAGMFAAAGYFDYRRLPEFFSGASRLGEGGPARCPRADPLQAWSSGALLFMLINLLGLEPDGFLRRLRIVRPMLPESVDRLELRALRVGAATVDLIFERRGGKVEVSVGRRDGTLDIEA